MAKRNVDFARRIESFSVDTVERRLARTLLHLSERLGKPDGNGSVRLMPLTHETLSRIIGTSREVVTQYMNALRRRGCVQYSRRETTVYPEALAASLVIPQGATTAVPGF
jgi:CRP-like cAMP-binding protein